MFQRLPFSHSNKRKPIISGNPVLALLVLFLIFQGTTLAQVEESSASEILELINEKRSEARNCGDKFYEATGPLKWSNVLEATAISHSQDMFREGYFSHQNLAGESSYDRIMKSTNVFNATAENIAWGQRSVAGVIQSWINSPGHCSNIMNPIYTHVGVGLGYESNENNKPPYWTMKLGRAIPENVPEKMPESKPEVANLELDKVAILERLNHVRQEGVYCSEQAERKSSANHPLEWHDDLEYSARARIGLRAENGAEVLRGDDRDISHASIGRNDDFNRGRIVYEIASDNFEDALRNWLSDPVACRYLMNPFITFVGIAAAGPIHAQTGESDAGAKIHWALLTTNVTPKSMEREIASYFRGKDITVYGRNRCSLTQKLHRELSDFDIEHRYAFYDGWEGPNRDKMHQALRESDKSVQGAPGLPYVIVGNTAYQGFPTVISLYRAMQKQ